MTITSALGIQISNPLFTSINNKNRTTTKSVQLAGSSGGNRNFGFVAVTITEDMIRNLYSDKKINGAHVTARTAGSKTEVQYQEVDPQKVQAVELPECYDNLKDSYRYYYHGENISDYELIQTAVASGKMEMPSENGDALVARDAFKVLVEDEAAKKNAWSDTLYSEDGRYTFTKTADGKTKDASAG